MPLLEKVEEMKFVEWVHANGGHCLKLVLTGARGFPDRTVLMQGKTLFFEFKRLDQGSVITPQQMEWVTRLTDLGHYVWVVESAQEAIEWTQLVLEATNHDL